MVSHPCQYIGISLFEYLFHFWNSHGSGYQLPYYSPCTVEHLWWCVNFLVIYLLQIIGWPISWLTSESRFRWMMSCDNWFFFVFFFFFLMIFLLLLPFFLIHFVLIMLIWGLMFGTMFLILVIFCFVYFILICDLLFFLIYNWIFPWNNRRLNFGCWQLFFRWLRRWLMNWCYFHRLLFF